jgi:hypothetical protein
VSSEHTPGPVGAPDPNGGDARASEAVRSIGVGLSNLNATVTVMGVGLASVDLNRRTREFGAEVHRVMGRSEPTLSP